VRGVGFIQYGLLFPDVSTGLCDVFEGIGLRCFISGQDTIHFTEFDCSESSLQSATREVHTDDALIYPNPTTGKVNIPSEFAIVDVMNLHGQIQAYSHSQYENVIDIDALEPGIYIFRLRKESGEHVYFSRIIKI
jgi:hypothetical protein